MATVKIDKNNFQTDVLQAAEPVVVDFWAEWCGPCKMIAPALDEIATEMGGKVKIAKVNIDENPGARRPVRRALDPDADDLQGRRSGRHEGRRGAEDGAVRLDQRRRLIDRTAN